MYNFSYDDNPLKNSMISFNFCKANKCESCNKFYGLLHNDKYLCSECSGLMNINKKKTFKTLYDYLSKYDILDKKKFQHLVIFCKEINTIVTKDNVKKISHLLHLCLLLLLTNNKDYIVLSDISSIFKHKFIVNLDEIKNLLSLKQAEELLYIFNREKLENSYCNISHIIARFLKEPWKQSNVFHPSSLCYYGNFGNKIYGDINRIKKFYNRMHNFENTSKLNKFENKFEFDLNL
tara:strand:- start:144 stop:848 length:705 start_codon:yes stop_codon:yes gene_type:complete